MTDHLYAIKKLVDKLRLRRSYSPNRRDSNKSERSPSPRLSTSSPRLAPSKAPSPIDPQPHGRGDRNQQPILRRTSQNFFFKNLLSPERKSPNDNTQASKLQDGTTRLSDVGTPGNSSPSFQTTNSEKPSSPAFRIRRPSPPIEPLSPGHGGYSKHSKVKRTSKTFFFNSLPSPRRSLTNDASTTGHHSFDRASSTANYGSNDSNSIVHSSSSEKPSSPAPMLRLQRPSPPLEKKSVASASKVGQTHPTKRGSQTFFFKNLLSPERKSSIDSTSQRSFDSLSPSSPAGRTTPDEIFESPTEGYVGSVTPMSTGSPTWRRAVATPMSIEPLVRVRQQSDSSHRKLSLTKSMPMSPTVTTREMEAKQYHDIQLKLDALTSELMAMRRTDQEIAKKLLNIYSEIQSIKMARSCLQYSELLDEAFFDAEMADEVPDMCDAAPKSINKVLMRRGVTSFNISNRRFSCS